MSKAKIGLLLCYAILALLAVTQYGTQIGIVARWILLVLVVVHTLEVAVFFQLCRKAGGSLAGHLINVFFFGVLHVKDMREASN
jgi:uncharacterized protein YhhL (DUF1145 family)